MVRKKLLLNIKKLPARRNTKSTVPKRSLRAIRKEPPPQKPSSWTKR